MNIYDDFDDFSQNIINLEKEIKMLKFKVVDFMEKMFENWKRNILSQASLDEKVGLTDMMATIDSYLEVISNNDLKRMPKLLEEFISMMSTKLTLAEFDVPQNSPNSDTNYGDISDFE